MITLDRGADNESTAGRHDALTGLLDAAHAKQRLAQWLDEWRLGIGAPLHAMLIAAGRIDTVNLAFGPSMGDSALVEIASRVLHFAKDEFETSDWIAARLSGGTYMLAARDNCSRERWQWFAEALADAIAMPIELPEEVGRSVRLWPRVALMRCVEGDEPNRIFDQLATALQRAREERGRRVAWVSGELAHVAVSNQQLEADMLTAIDRGEIEIVFQPQYDMATDRMIGAEALARWQHPEIGRLGANTLFTLAERTDHVAQLSRHIAERALELATRWPEHLTLSLNVTPADLAAGNFALDFLEIVGRSGFSSERLTIEITEEVLLADLEELSRALVPLRLAGVSIALDDFGSGYSNFRYLKMLPIEKLKLDRSMIEGIAEDSRDLAVLRGITAMAKALGLQVIAEGIEEEAQRIVLHGEGIQTYQGFLKSLPLSQSEFLSVAGIESAA